MASHDPDGASIVLVVDGGSDHGPAGLPADGDGRVLRIAVAGSADDVLRDWRRRAGELPRRGCVVSVGETTRSGGSDPGAIQVADGVSVVAVPDPEDVDAVERAADDRLAAWEGTGGIVRVDAVGVLVERVGADRIVRFLRRLARRAERVGATVYCHVDPAAVDRGRVDELAPLVDAVIDPRSEASTVAAGAAGDDVGRIGVPAGRVLARLGVTHDGIAAVSVGGMIVMLTLSAAILVFHDQYGLGLAALALAGLNLLLIAGPLRE